VSGQVRLERGNPNIVDLPRNTADEIFMGDVLVWSSGVVRPASTVTGADHPTRSNTVGTNFAGIAMAYRAANDPGTVPVATDGDFAMPFTGTAPTPGSLVRIADNSGSPHRQTVESTTANTAALGRCINAGGSIARIRILSRMNERSTT
jgi:predicted RecA/RadA family phage recombinase